MREVAELVAELGERDRATVSLCDLDDPLADVGEHVGVVVERFADPDGAARGPQRGQIVRVEL